MLRRLVLLLFALAGAPARRLPRITVYKSPTCGCCKEWVKHLRANGFSVTSKDVPDVTPH